MNTGIQLPKERVALLAPSDVEAYLLDHGWQEDLEGSSADVGSFRYRTDGEVTALVPRDRSFLDYAVRVGDVLHTLALLERRPIWEVLETLLALQADSSHNGSAVREPKTADRSRTPKAKREKRTDAG